VRSYSDLITLDNNFTSYSDNTTTPGNTYKYRLWAENIGGASSFSNQVAILVVSIPMASSTLPVQQLSENEISLQWVDNSNNEDNFAIQRRLSGGIYTDLFTTCANAENYTDNTVTPGNTYQYRVRATNIRGTSTYSNQVIIFGELTENSILRKTLLVSLWVTF